MSLVGRTLVTAAVAGLVLAACGGGNIDGSTVTSRQAGQGITVGEPNGGVPVVSEYIQMAQEASCASTRNKLYVVDSKYVLWDRAGNCADNAYGQVLMGPTPQAVLCSAGQTIAGPRTSCTDATLRPLFDTMLENLDKADLGLGAGHQVEPVDFLPKSGSPIAYQTIVSERFSKIATPREVVIKDAAAWTALWAEHAGSEVALPKVDFSRQMVIGVFRGAQPDGCRTTAISAVDFRDGKLNVLYVDTVPGPGMVCSMAVVHPAALVIVNRSEAPVHFIREVRTLQ
ncbi:hypothetical protein IM543_07970 [Massilia sp. UMI-21]|nr:hypothetical protein IM543_07970 [Massilia sp. UMI-21]